ncbi:phosphotransferase [Thiomicrorhabdus xiamenensis]|uniref:Phosphotransferase n=1 Tax=Thiomicrorhabdus xiamenensis TaxID=2739063 RepID=A0A7D4NRF6_9GAMM|nr:phosphotransferase [Thiomicrorhabdus xiamenensis]QKI89872.1 phosphotransferase [Thiomicrorhabdus xiamenensis]
MNHFPEVYESLRFLLIDLQKQLQTIYDGIAENDPSLFLKSLERIDYIENAHLSLLNRSYNSSLRQDREYQAQLQGFEHISYSLHHLSSQLEALCFQLEQCKSLKLLQKKRIFAALEDLNKGLSLIEPAVESEELTLSIDICQLQGRIEKSCRQQLDRYQDNLKTGQYSQALMQSSFIVRDILNMADALLKIGEGIISGKLGQFIQIDRYQTLEASLSELDYDLTEQSINIHSMGETKSGCTISGVTSASEAQEEILAIFKQGRKDKLLEEKIGIESWHEKFPGIAPEVYSYQKQGDKAALLFEYLTGKTFDKLLLEDRQALQSGLNRLFATLSEIWQATEKSKPISANFMRQLQKRLKNVYAVHPEFNLKSKGLRIGDAQQASLEQLIKQAAKLEEKFQVANAVYIHGDFNVDNILYDAEKDDISFIDLHRSEYLDYTQDLSVLMVSFYRLTNYDPKVRRRIRLTIEAIYDFGADYAEQNNDNDYAKRMALGLARSFISSTRFVLDKEHAKSMLFKGRYLLEQLINLPKKELPNYQLPKELFRD